MTEYIVVIRLGNFRTIIGLSGVLSNVSYYMYTGRAEKKKKKKKKKKKNQI